MTRRKFLETGAGGAGAFFLSTSTGEGSSGAEGSAGAGGRFPPPLAVSTWKYGASASRAALAVLRGGGSPLDAVERGINEVERDPSVESVGLGGLPNEEGAVELDAAIMDGSLRCGSVMDLREIAVPISVARRVMERTRHIQLAGEGALRFALAQGFRRQDLLTPEARAKWERWKSSPDRKVPGQVDEKDAPGAPPRPGAGGAAGHDTVATLALDGRGGLAAGCSTSGLAWKMPGRVGDSPIIGAGLYCDGEVGAAAGTGIGEEILRICGSFAIVEALRRGASPSAAIEEVLRRVLKADRANRKRQVAFIALSRSGEVAAGAMRPGFVAAIAAGDGRELLLDVPPFAGG